MIIGINSGHTIKGPGCGASKYLVESIETRKVCEELKKELANKGHTVVNCTVDSSPTELANLASIVSLANNETLDLFISVHFNAGAGSGVEVYTYEGRQFADALNVCSNISALGFPNRGVKEGTGLYVIRHTKAKSLLIEVCFVDNLHDASTYQLLGANKIAKAIANAIPTQYKQIKPKKPVEKDVSKPVCVLYSTEADLFYGALALAQKKHGILCRATDINSIPELQKDFKLERVGGPQASYAGKDRFETLKKVSEVL